MSTECRGHGALTCTDYSSYRRHRRMVGQTTQRRRTWRTNRRHNKTLGSGDK